MSRIFGITAWSLPSPGVYTLPLCKLLGFDAVQLDFGDYDRALTYSSPIFRRLLLEESRETGVRILPLTLNALGGHGFVEGLDTDDGRKALRIIDAGLDAAAAMGLEGVAVPNFGGNEIHTPAHLDATAKALRHACLRAQTMGLTVYTENVLHPDELTRLFADCGCDNLRLLFDSQNYAAFGHDDALAVLDAFWDKLGSYIHVKDGTTAMGSMPLGQGWSPLQELAQRIRARGFDGAIVLENNYDAPPLCRPLEADVTDAIRTDLDAMRRLFG